MQQKKQIFKPQVLQYIGIHTLSTIIVLLYRMASIIFYLQFAIISVPSVVSAQENTCKACNCQFSNVDIVSQLIDSKLAATGINELGKLAIAIIIY